MEKEKTSDNVGSIKNKGGAIVTGDAQKAEMMDKIEIYTDFDFTKLQDLLLLYSCVQDKECQDIAIISFCSQLLFIFIALKAFYWKKETSPNLPLKIPFSWMKKVMRWK